MAKLWQIAVESVTKRQEEAYDALFDEAVKEHLKGDCADCEDGLCSLCEYDIVSSIEDRQEEQFDDQAKAEYDRLEEEFRTLDQDLKPIEEGGKYLDEVRYPEVRLFHFLWSRFQYESAAEIASAFKAHMEQWNVRQRPVRAVYPRFSNASRYGREVPSQAVPLFASRDQSRKRRNEVPHGS